MEKLLDELDAVLTKSKTNFNCASIASCKYRLSLQRQLCAEVIECSVEDLQRMATTLLRYYIHLPTTEINELGEAVSLISK